MKPDARKAERQEAAERRQVERLRLHRAWEREGYRPRAHLDSVLCEGEILTLLSWGSRERHFVDASWPSREQKIPAVLALWDIAEIASTQGYRRQR